MYLRDGEVLFAYTDESAHIYVQGKTAYLLECGSPVEQNGLEAVISNSGIEEVVIFITHFHSDHS